MHYFDDLIQHFRATVPLSDADVPKVVAQFRSYQVKKKNFLLQAGDVSRHMRFIASGCLRAYYLDEDLQEHTLQFGIEGWWINDLYSYLTQTPARHFIQAIENSVVLQIHQDALNQLFDEVPMIERFFRLKIQRGYVHLQERMTNQMSQDSKQRYLDFRAKYGDIEQRVPQYMIASYLGITPEFLSTLRKAK
ncbi:MAG: Crp/Fnr family transcriptional regulator [Saprospiraceae bacterium]